MKQDNQTLVKSMSEVQRDFPELKVIPIVLNGEQRLGLGRIRQNADGTHTCEVMAILVSPQDAISIADITPKFLN